MTILYYFRFNSKPRIFYSYLKHNDVSRFLHRYHSNVSVSRSQCEQLEAFQDVLPCVVNTISSRPHFAKIPDVASSIRKMLENSFHDDKRMKGLTVVSAYESCEKPERLTAESMQLARIMGWCLEMFQVYLSLIGDLMDRSTTRRYVPCSNTMPEVGSIAMSHIINDAVMIHTATMDVLRYYFSKMPQYSEVLDLINGTHMFLCKGHILDHITRSSKNYSLFTRDQYNSIITYKSGIYTHRLPVCLGLLLADVTDEETMKKAEQISTETGKLFQIQDDFVDCYGHPSVVGEEGTDIAAGKCTWLAVSALQRCSPAQREQFEQNYGRQQPANVASIKLLYDELHLFQLYEEEERSWYDRVARQVQLLRHDKTLSLRFFAKILNKQIEREFPV